MMPEPEVNLTVAKEHGLSETEYAKILDRLGRTPTWVELGILSVMWSEHCSYKSSRRHLAKLPTKAPWVLQGPGENAGVIEVGNGLAACFKMESHNHPSFISPYQGAATGVGGIMRDVFTMGARPVANMNSLRFGRPEVPHMRFLVEGVVSGIGGYGNCMGVPTVGGEVAFDASYDGNILVNAFTLGVLRSDRIFRSAAAGIGSSVMYVGSKTGRDGIHGATMASEEFDQESESKRPRVQVGDPFTEKKLLEACLELMKTDSIVAIQDMGAAGLTSSGCEMAAKGKVGIRIDTLKVPRRETGMTSYEVMLSESQERMLMVVKPGSEAQVHEIFEKWDLAVAVIGEVTDGSDVVVAEGDLELCRLPVSLLDDDAPNYDRPHHAPKDLEARWVLPELEPGLIMERLERLLAQPTIASKRWVYEQYDHTVRAATVVGPGAADAAVIRMPDAELAPTNRTRQGLAMTVDMNGRYVSLDPRRGAMLGVMEAARNLVCVGALPRATTDCLNFGNPEKPEVMWSFVEAIEGMAEACEALQTPIVSGNVSLYNETEGRAIIPTPTIGMVGIVDDVDRTCTMGFRQAGAKIVLLGSLDAVCLGGSELVLMETATIAGRPAEPDLERATAVHGACLELVRGGLVDSAHDAAEGGLLVALAECCIQGELGAKVQFASQDGLLRQAFGEGPSVIVLSVSDQNLEAVLSCAATHGAPAQVIGEVGGDALEIENVGQLGVATMTERWANGLQRALSAPEAASAS